MDKKRGVREFIKKETVLCAAVVLAVLSSFFVLPDKEYVNYIDYQTLVILFCLMAVMAGFQKLGIFRWVAWRMLSSVKKQWQLIAVLVFMCFFFSMIITNDVALITFVPFTLTMLGMMSAENRKKLIIPVIVLQTVAANLGSMLTPVGNPQNLYLFSRSSMGMRDFIELMFPYSLAAALLLMVLCVIIAGRVKFGDDMKISEEKAAEYSVVPGSTRDLIIYIVLFGVCLLTVTKQIPAYATLVIVIATLLAADRSIFKKVDYALLVTFTGFFIFVGNMGRLPAFRGFIESIIKGHEVITAVLASQVISNVPAAILLSGFTDSIRCLVIGTNIGGLGTLIASMASLISFKYAVMEEKSLKTKYFIGFTVTNIVFLAVMLLMWTAVG